MITNGGVFIGIKRFLTLRTVVDITIVRSAKRLEIAIADYSRTDDGAAL